MNSDDASQIMMRLHAIWPSHHLQEDTATEYFRYLSFHEYDDMNDRVDELAQTNRYFPAIADLASVPTGFFDDNGEEMDEGAYYAQQTARMNKKFWAEFKKEHGE